MRVRRSDLAHGPHLDGAVVVIDVLRAFSTAAYAFAAGARVMVVAHSLDEVDALRRRHAPCVTVGAHAGGRPVPGFDHANSPSEIARRDLAGLAVIEYTAGGVRGLVDCEHAPAVLAGSLVCARATAEYLRRLQPDIVTLVVTGLWTDRDGDEDHACADLIEAHLAGEQPWLEDYERRVRDSDFGRRFGRSDQPHLSLDDLELCATADRFDFAMPMRRTADDLVIRAVSPLRGASRAAAGRGPSAAPGRADSD